MASSFSDSEAEYRLDAVSPFLTDVLHELVLGTTPSLSCINGGILPPGSVKGKGKLKASFSACSISYPYIVP